MLLIGAILTPGQRTVAAALRVMGRSDQRDYARYHEVLNRAVWSSPPGSAHPAGAVAPAPGWWRRPTDLRHRRDPGTASRRQDQARAIYRDPVRSSRSQVVKASGLRWISLMWLGHVPWAGRHWLGFTPNPPKI